MSDPNVTWAELAEGVDRPDGEVHELIVKRIRAHLIEMEDANFHFDSSVFMAKPRRTVAADGGGDLTGIAVIAGVLGYAAEHDDKRVLVVGHTDTVGSRAYNKTLSEKRAKNVHAYTAGDRDEWSSLCQARFKVEDWQRILKWVDEAHQYDCDPGEVDNRYGPASRRARERFRTRYNEEFGASLRVRGQQIQDDWKAFFDMYELSLAQLVGVEVSDLQGKRDAITFVDPPVLACGEQWPKEGRGDEYLRSEKNRRVEILFFEEGELDDFANQTPPGADLYRGERRYPRRRIPIGGADYLELEVIDLGRNPVPNEDFELDLPHGVTRTGTLGADGKVRIEDIPPGECALRFPNIEQAHDPQSIATGSTQRVTVQRRSILVKVESSFLFWGTPELDNHPVEDAVIELPDEGRSITYNNDGEPMPLDITDLADGDYLLKVSPKSEATTQDPAGPALEPDEGVEAAYRVLEMTLTLAAGQITDVVLANPGDKHGKVVGFTQASVEIDLKPDWLASPNGRPRGGAAIDMVVLQHSGAMAVGPTFEAYLSTAGKASSAHYVVDVDGFVVKMVRDADAACHCSAARWAGNTNVRERSLAIELVHQSGALPPVQLQAVVDLIKALVAEHGFPEHHVLGIEDVATSRSDPALVGRKIGDPGPDFDWKLLEDETLGLQLSGASPNVNTIYDGQLAAAPQKLTASSSAASISELQTDLIAIGYSARPTGVFDKHTRAALRQFVLHFVKHARAAAPPMDYKELNGRELGTRAAGYLKQCMTW